MAILQRRSDTTLMLNADCQRVWERGSGRGLPKGVNVGRGGEWKVVLVVAGAHPAHDLWRQVANPAVRQLQLVLPSGNDKSVSKKMKNLSDRGQQPAQNNGKCKGWSDQNVLEQRVCQRAAAEQKRTRSLQPDWDSDMIPSHEAPRGNGSSSSSSSMCGWGPAPSVFPVPHLSSWTTPEIPKRPKSVITTLLVSWKTFFDFKSLCTMPLACRYPIPWKTNSGGSRVHIDLRRSAPVATAAHISN